MLNILKSDNFLVCWFWCCLLLFSLHVLKYYRCKQKFSCMQLYNPSPPQSARSTSSENFCVFFAFFPLVINYFNNHFSSLPRNSVCQLLHKFPPTLNSQADVPALPPAWICSPPSTTARHKLSAAWHLSNQPCRHQNRQSCTCWHWHMESSNGDQRFKSSVTHHQSHSMVNNCLIVFLPL